MKKLTDEEIQQLLDSKSYTPASLDLNEDAKLYKLVFEELNKEPDFTLPEDFSFSVTEKIWQQSNRYSFITPNVILFVSILAALLISTGTMAYINPAMLMNALAVGIQFKWIILFGLAILALVEIGDKLLVRRRIT